MTSDLTDDGFLGGRLKLLQPKRGHRVGTDAALLVAAARDRMPEGARVADFGAGVGAVGLSLAHLGAAHVMLAEIDPHMAALAAENAARNMLADRAEALGVDVADLGRSGAPGPGPDSLDLVVANPPFDAAGRFRGSPDTGRATAHIAADGLLEVWTRVAARVLKPGAVFVMVHRPEAVGEALAACAGRFGDLRLKPVHARPGEPAIRILIAAAKGRRGVLALLPGLVLHDASGGFTAEADAIQRGDAAIGMT